MKAVEKFQVGSPKYIIQWKDQNGNQCNGNMPFHVGGGIMVLRGHTGQGRRKNSIIPYDTAYTVLEADNLEEANNFLKKNS